MRFHVGLTGDLFNSSGAVTFGEGPLAILDEAAGTVSWERLGDVGAVVPPEVVGACEALYVNTPKLTRESLSRGAGRLRIVARHGVGYDSIDTAALTEHGILLTNTPLAIRRPVATMTLTFMLVLAQRLMLKDRLTRDNRWHERIDFMGMGLTGRTLGIVGVGGIAGELIRLVAPFEMRVLGAGRRETARSAVAAGPAPDDGVERVRLDELLARSDFVVLACPLNETTHHLIGARELALMRPTAYLINVARGPVVDEPALIAALRNGTIAGAGLDVFETEPVAPDNPLLAMDQVVLSPHSLAWTDETFGGIARTALTSIVDMAAHRRPVHVVNSEALDHPRVRAWLGG